MNIFLFDPSLRDSAGSPSINLGDLIIRRAVDDILNEIFPQASIQRVSSHQFPDLEILQQAQQADLVLVGGTNLLSSHILEYDQWKLSQNPQHYAEPLNLRAVLLGVGWWQYQDKPDLITRHYYRQLLHSDLPHAVRDEYSSNQLASCGVRHILNTSCPTLWSLDGLQTRRKTGNKRCLFCLTDYKQDPASDNRLIELLLQHYPGGLIFFPQGNKDEAYAATLPAFQENASIIQCLPHEIKAFYQAVEQGGMDYVGTRLHAGAWCLQKGLPSLILTVDNRSLEIAKDINLPVAGRNDETAIILEDDIATHPGFLSYMNAALNLYKHSSQVGVISAFNYVYSPEETKVLPETYFLRQPGCWGWGTWRDRWQLFEHNIDKLLAKIAEREAIHAFNADGHYPFYELLQRTKEGLTSSWGVMWYASLFLHDKISLWPRQSMTANIGFDGTGVHCTTALLPKVMPHSLPSAGHSVNLNQQKPTINEAGQLAYNKASYYLAHGKDADILPPKNTKSGMFARLKNYLTGR